MKLSFHDLSMESSDISDEESKSESLNDTSNESIDAKIIDLDEQRNSECIQTTSIKPSSDDNNDWQVLITSIAQAGPVVSKLECLIKEGRITRDRIFYRYLHDTVVMFYNTRHQYHTDVVEFFSTITYLGGRGTFNFVKGPMFFGQGGSFEHNFHDVRMNLGWPSETKCNKSRTAFTTKSGVPKSLTHLQLKLLTENTSNLAKALLSNDILTVFPYSYRNDGTAIKAAVEYDSVSKTNVGLPCPVDSSIIRENSPPDPQMLYDKIVTEEVVGSITTIGNKMPLPITVDYFSKSGKTGDALTELFMQHLRILQMCQLCTIKAKSDRLTISDYSNCVSFCQTCCNSNEICFECKALGDVSIYPALRVCQNCINEKQRYIKRAVPIVTTDFEEGNKKMFINLKKN